jgi:hypothetical protein
MVLILSQAHHFIYTEYPTLNKGEEMPTKVIVDCSTGETSIVELTAEEIADLEAAQKAAESERVEREAKEAADATAKSALLKKLGITQEEARLLLS